jgi:hypothetical protein
MSERSAISSPLVRQSQRPVADFESELVTITPHGFEPTEIVRPKGAFQLAIEDRSGLETLSLQLSRSVGARLLNMRSLRTEPNWNEVVDLEPGEYVLTAVENPRWTCRLIITAR